MSEPHPTSPGSTLAYGTGSTSALTWMIQIHQWVLPLVCQPCVVAFYQVEEEIFRAAKQREVQVDLTGDESGVEDEEGSSDGHLTSGRIGVTHDVGKSN